MCWTKIDATIDRAEARFCINRCVFLPISDDSRIRASRRREQDRLDPGFIAIGCDFPGKHSAAEVVVTAKLLGCIGGEISQDNRLQKGNPR